MIDDEATTRSMLETILERLDDLRRENQEFRKSAEEKFDILTRENADFRKSMETRLDDFGQRLDGFEYRLDNIEKQFSLSRVDVLDVKMELRELRNQLKEHLLSLK